MIGEDVLIIGKGPSDFDIFKQLSGIANTVTHSAYKPIVATSSSNVKSFSNGSYVKRFTGTNEVEFQNNTKKNFTVVIYATGNLEIIAICCNYTTRETLNLFVNELFRHSNIGLNIAQ